MVRERAWEIGTLKAIGAANRGIIGSVLVEGLGLCAVGALVGAVLFALGGGPLASRVFAFGVTPFLPPHYRDLLGGALSLTAGPGPPAVGVLVAAVIVVAVAGSPYALRQVVRLSPNGRASRWCGGAGGGPRRGVPVRGLSCRCVETAQWPR